MSGIYKKLLTASSAQTDEFFNSVSLLLHGDGTDGAQNNTFLDGSTNNFTLARNGNTTQGSYSPYLPAGPYDPSTYGGSAYFDGAGDWLTFTGATSGAGDFTTEAWVNLSVLRDYLVIFDNRATGVSATGYAFGVDAAGSPYLYTGAFRIVSSITITVNTWNHLALVRNGTTITLYVNGVSGGTYTSSANFSDTNSGIGAAPTYTPSSQFFGYISDLRIVNGTAIYNSSFTPPTEPLTAVANTSLLCNFTNAAIFDYSAKNVLETVGNAQIDTAVKKYGTGSMKFDGTGDYVVQPTNLNYGYGTGDFTIEFWLYLNSTGIQTIVSNLSSASSTNPHIYVNSTIRYWTAGGDRIVGAALSTGQWYHIAVCRTSGSTKLFVDGAQSGSTYSDPNNYGATAPLGIGTYWSGGSPVTSTTLNGYIDDLRITKGVSRYTENFTPPNRAFPDQ